MAEVHIYIGVDSIVPRISKRHIGYVLECKMGGQPVTREGFEIIDGTYNKATIMAITKALGRLKTDCTVFIHTENMFVGGMIENNLVSWTKNGFVTSKGKPVSNQKEWMALWCRCQRHELKVISGKHEYTGWLLSEMNKRREKADV